MNAKAETNHECLYVKLDCFGNRTWHQNIDEVCEHAQAQLTQCKAFDFCMTINKLT